MKVLGHPKTLQRLENVVLSSPHAIGLLGEKGAGKGHMTEHLAAKILGIGIDKITSHPYVNHVDAGNTSAGIDQIREIQSFLKLKVPGEANIRRVVIVKDIDSLGSEAQNSLLKTLEEPPHDTVIIVSFSKPERVLPTIHSRLQTTQVLPVELDAATQYFADDYSMEEITKAMHISGGLAGLLTAILEEKDEHPLIIAIQQARELLTANRYARLSKVDSLVKSKQIQPELLLDGLYRLLDASYKLSLERNSLDKLKPLAVKLRLVEAASEDLRANVQAKLVLSRLLFQL